MNVFISWSGDESRKIAAVIADAVRDSMPTAKVFFSAEDLKTGDNWTEVIQSRLKEADVALLILTPKNLRSPWMLYEAGVLSARLPRGRMVPVLVGLEPSDIPAPLNQFQCVTLEKNSVRNLLASLGASSTLADKPLERFSQEIEGVQLSERAREFGSTGMHSFSAAFDKSWAGALEDIEEATDD